MSKKKKRGISTAARLLGAFDENRNPAEVEVLHLASPLYDGDATDLVPDSLDGIERFKGLRHLFVRTDKPLSLAPLRGLTSLEHLHLVGKGFSDLDAITSLPALRTLELWGIKGRRQPSVALRSESLRYLRLYDLGLKRGLVIEAPSLEVASLNYNTDLAELDLATPRLRWLALTDSKVADLAPLTSLTRLEGLTLARSKKVADLSPLLDLTSLQHLELMMTGVRSIEGIKRLCRLRHLDLGMTKVKDLTPAFSLKALEVLYFEDTKVKNLKGIDQLRALRRTGRAVSPEAIPDRVVLGRDGEPDRFPSPPPGVHVEHPIEQPFKPDPSWRVRSVRLVGEGAAHADIDLSGVTHVEIVSSALPGINALPHAANGESLRVDTQAEFNLDGLDRFPSLRHLRLGGRQPADLSPLANAPGLRLLVLGTCKTDDIRPLRACTGLRTFTIHGEQTLDAQTLRGLAELEVLKVSRRASIDDDEIRAELEGKLAVFRSIED
ncbi:MAG: hypothetical protein AAGE52_06340 [Myxococcota bacterium]